MENMLKPDEFVVFRGNIYKVLKIDEEKGWVLLSAMEMNDKMSKKVKVVIEHAGWDILRVGNKRARLKKDRIEKRIEKKKSDEEVIDVEEEE